MSLPYPAVVPDGTCVYYVSDYEDGAETGTLTLTKVDAGEVIPAKQGFLFNGVKGLYRFEKSMTAGSWTGNMLVGTADAPLTDYDYSTATDPVYVLAKMDDDTVGFKKYTGTSIDRYKAYLQLGTAPTARAFRFNFSSDTKGINEIGASDPAIQAFNVVYDLQGRRIEKSQLSNKKGLYIVGGKIITTK
jgi:hypothetical protein